MSPVHRLVSPAVARVWVSLLAALLVCSVGLVAVTSGRSDALAVPPDTAPIVPPSVDPTAGTAVTVATETGESVVTVGEYAAVGVADAAACVAICVAATGFAIGWYGVKAFKWLAHKVSSDSPTGGASFALTTGLHYVTGTGWLYNVTAEVPYDNQLWGAAVDLSNGCQLKGHPDPSSFGVGDVILTGNRFADSYSGTGTATDGSGASCFGGMMEDESIVPRDVIITRYDQAQGAYLGVSLLPLTAADPTRHLRMDVSCQDDTGLITHITADGALFDASTAYGSPPNSPQVMCPAGAHAVGANTQLVDPNGNTEAGPQWQAQPKATDPGDPNAQCLALAGGTPCQLGLVDGVCKWGPYTLSGGDCGSDPTTSPTPTPTPTGTPTAGPGTISGPAPAVDPTGGGCFPSGWGLFNPVEWVLKPVKCALVWAFVPSAATVTALEHAGDGFMARPPLSFVSDFPGWIAPLAAGGTSACPDWTVYVGAHPYSVVCDQPFMQRIHSYRGFFLALMMLTAVSGFLWSLWYAVLPFVRANPTTRIADSDGGIL